MTPKEFATEVVSQLQQAGYQALFAGGCVRDQMLGREPKDYDVATSATPQQVRDLFGRRRTIAIGESFGVITVIGKKESGNIEVATFRRDAEYSDGRHPDAIEFTDAREDAIRRDFTINGMFFDPIAQELIDYVEGRADIDCKIIRAIGNPEERIAEDKLRMLRAIRFASTFEFEIDTDTMSAVEKHAEEITAVSPERIGAEMRRMLAHPNRALAVQLLKQSGLLDRILLDGQLLYANRANWRTRTRWLQALGAEGSFEQAAWLLLSRLIKTQQIQPTVARWKLSNAEAATISWFENNLMIMSRAHQLPWSQIQPLLIHADAPAAAALLAVQFGTNHEGYKLCRERLDWSAEELNPGALIDGRDLKQMNIPPGPIFSKILNDVRAAQLDGQITDSAEAQQMAADIHAADCLLYTSPSPRDQRGSRMPSSA